MKRTTLMVMALAMVLGLAQCKKEQSITPDTQGVTITLNLEGNNNGAKVNVDPYTNEQVTFEDGDQILVASGGQYIGTLTRENGAFSGSVTNPVEGQRLYFYFLGNKQGTLEAGTTTCTVNISDQTEELPVISMGQSTVNYTEGETSYSSRLYNKASLMKFNVTTPSTAAICLTGMNNTVTVNFGEPTATNYGFTYGIDAEDGGLIKMPGVTTENTETWAIVLPQAALEAGGENSAYTADLRYLGTRPAMEEIEMNTFLNLGLDLSVGTANPHFKDLSLLQGDLTAQDGDILSGTLANKLKISIAEGASVTLSNANINENGTWTDGDYAGITCLGDAIIILEGTNTVKGFNSTYPGVQAGPDGTTLTIDGSGTLNATGGSDGAAGIGSGKSTSCGNITITTGVTSVTATKGTGARDSIGRGKGKGTCGTVMFGDETIYDGSLWIIAPESGSAYGGLSFSITTVTNTDDTWVLQPE